MTTETGFTVRQLAETAGVSARTLHYYDQIGLLIPRRDPGNGYRRYDRPALLRLQQILFLRELGMPLDEIKLVLDRPEFNLLAALERHRLALQARQARTLQLLQTVERTITHLKGQHDMNDKDLFNGFDEKEYEDEARRRWGESDAYKESTARWKKATPAEQQQLRQGWLDNFQAWAAAAPFGPDSPQAQAAAAAWHAQLRRFYEPSRELMLGLVDMYNEDERFKANYERFQPDLAGFVRQAVRIYLGEA
ncbi:MAG: MerR family transcriptional regulator [Chloroflexota bacterium]